MIDPKNIEARNDFDKIINNVLKIREKHTDECDNISFGMKKIIFKMLQNSKPITACDRLNVENLLDQLKDGYSNRLKTTLQIISFFISTMTMVSCVSNHPKGYKEGKLTKEICNEERPCTPEQKERIEYINIICYEINKRLYFYHSGLSVKFTDNEYVQMEIKENGDLYVCDPECRPTYKTVKEFMRMYKDLFRNIMKLRYPKKLLSNL